MDWLLTQKFDHVNFPDFQGLAIATLQGKLSGMFHKAPAISVTLHGPNRWALEANNVFFQLEHHSEIEFFERFSIQHCDVLIAPSRFILDWVINQGWKVSTQTYILQNPIVFGRDQLKNKSTPLVDENKKTVCFFGRLEPRKGVRNFLLAAEPYLQSANILLVGGDSPGNDPFDGFDTKSPIRDIQLIQNLNSMEAQQFFHDNGALVVIPSLSENCPYSVIETCTYGNKIIASDVGGIPELLQKESLFDTKESLGNLIYKFIEGDTKVGILGLVKSNESAIADYINFFSNKSIMGSIVPEKVNDNQPKIGVIVAHYNQTDFLPRALASIQHQSYTNFQCIVIDDGSNSSEFAKFEAIREVYKNDERFVFFSQENKDVGATRNRGATLTESEYLTFLDSDDYMSVDCLELYMNSFRYGSRVTTSHFEIFEGENYFGSEFDIPIGTYEPFGACTDILWRKNCIGGANFAIEKELFFEVGKFNENRGSTHQDWQILTRIALKGIEAFVVPKRLLNYRAVKDSMSRTRSHQEGQMQVILEYSFSKEFKPEILLVQLMSEISSNNGGFTTKPMTYLLAEKIRIFVEKYFPLNSLRWRVIARVSSRLLR